MDVPGGDLTQKIIGCEYVVHNKLDVRFLEKVYKNPVNPDEFC